MEGMEREKEKEREREAARLGVKRAYSLYPVKLYQG